MPSSDPASLVNRLQGISGALGRKAPARVGTTGNIVLSGLQTIDGYLLGEGHRVLVKNQTNPAENGIYNASSGNWTRSQDFNKRDDVANGTDIVVAYGSQAGRNYTLSFVEPLTFGATAVVFTSIDAAALADGGVVTVKLGDGAVTTPKIADQNVTFAKLPDVAPSSFLGRLAGVAGSVGVLTVANVKSLLGRWTNAELADAPPLTFKGNNSPDTTQAIVDMTPAQAAAILPAVRFDAAQGLLTTGQKSQARSNIDALGTDLPLGQCRFALNSATQCILLPYKGSYITIAGVARQISSSGVTISNSGLAANTLYYAYAYWTGFGIALEFSTTGHSAGADGTEIKTTDSNRTLVGMVRTDSSSQFGDHALYRGVRSWFNSRGIALQVVLQAEVGMGSGPFTEITTGLQGIALVWSGEAVHVAASASCYDAGGAVTTMYLAVLRAGTAVGITGYNTIPVGNVNNIAASYAAPETNDAGILFSLAGGFSSSGASPRYVSGYTGWTLLTGGRP